MTDTVHAVAGSAATVRGQRGDPRVGLRPPEEDEGSPAAEVGGPDGQTLAAGVGHWVQYERPALFARLVVGFLSDGEAGS